MSSYNVVECNECGYREPSPDTIPRKCPECGAEGHEKWKEKRFHKRVDKGGRR